MLMDHADSGGDGVTCRSKLDWLAVEKNLEAFLSLDLPGSKVVVGDGPPQSMAARGWV